MRSNDHKPGNDSAGTPEHHLPESLERLIASEKTGQTILATARHDLDDRGRYVEGYLALVGDEVGHFVRRDGEWDGSWRALDSVEKLVLVEGVGMNLLRLLKGEHAVGEFRFTLRHAKEVARFQRVVERRLKNEAPEVEVEPPPALADGKRIRCETCGRVIPPWSEVCPACLSRRKVLSRLMDFVKPYRGRAIAGFVLALAATAASLVRPFLTRPMLDEGLGLAPGRAPDYGTLLHYVFLMAGLTLVAAAAEGLRERIMAVLGSRISRDIRDRTYAHLHRLSLSFFSRKSTGSLVTRVTSDSDRIWDFVAFTIIEAVVAIATIVGVGVALALLDWRLACIVLLPVPVMFVLMIVFHKTLHTGFDRLFHRWSQMTAVAADALPGVRVIKAFSQERREVDRFGRKNREFFEDEVGMITVWTLFRPVMHLCTQVGTILVWVVGGYWVIRGRMSAGTLVAYVGYMWMFYGPIHMIAHMDRMFNRAATSVQRIFEILDTEPTIYSKAAPRGAHAIDGRIELRNVSFSYDGVRRVLKNVSMDIAPGEMVGLAGPSGGGKTTLVNLICRFYDVLDGEIRIDGVDIRDYDVEELRRRIGVVLQDPFLFHGTVASNIAYGAPDATMDDLIAAARAANAHEFILRFPDGYDTMVGERGHTLSGGERQRISIARAILHNPRILILDEATSSVDTETEKAIQEALDRLIARRTTIAIAHRLSTLSRANRLLILDKGELVEEGTHAALRVKEGGVYAKLLRLQNEMQSIMAIGG